MKKIKKEYQPPKESPMYNLKKGEQFIYYRGFTPRYHDAASPFRIAMHLFLRGKVLLVQRLIERTQHYDVKDQTSTFEYIAIGR